MPVIGEVMTAGLTAELREAMLRALMEDTSTAIAVTDAAGTMVMVSPAMQDLLRRPCAGVHAEDMPHHFIVRTEDGSRMLRPEEVPVTRAALLGESFRDVVVSVERPDAVVVYLRCSGAPLRALDGSIQGGIVQVADVTTELLQAREQGALRERLVETVNHELRTPLTKLLGHAELLEDMGDELPLSARRSIDAVQQAGNSLKDLAQTVSDLVELDSASRLDRAPVDVVELVRRTMARFEERAGLRGVQVVASFEDRPRVCLDERRAGKALGALLDNALTHSPVGAVVSVSVVADDKTCWVDVCDNGPGIPVRERARLVQPFERGDRPEQQVSARGLGLATAHAVAVAHGGDLSLRDNAPRGLRARLRLPLHDPPH